MTIKYKAYTYSNKKVAFSAKYRGHNFVFCGNQRGHTERDRLYILLLAAGYTHDEAIKLLPYDFKKVKVYEEVVKANESINVIR